MIWLQSSFSLTTGLLYVVVFLIGVVVFSFLNVVIYRLPKKLNIVKEKPVCDACGHVLSAGDLIPVFSWISLKGKCRYCNKKVSVRYLLIELFGGILAVFLTMYYGAGLEALTIFLFFSVLTVVTFIDIDVMEIPFILNIIIFVLGIISIWTVGDITILERIIGMLCISLPLFLIVLIIPEGFGGGDIKLMFAAGFFLGWKATVAAFLIGLLTGGIYGILCLVRRKKGKKDHFAFGPFLSVGLAISVFCGEALMNAYIGIIMAAFQP